MIQQCCEELMMSLCSLNKCIAAAKVAYFEARLCLQGSATNYAFSTRACCHLLRNSAKGGKLLQKTLGGINSFSVNKSIAVQTTVHGTTLKWLGRFVCLFQILSSKHLSAKNLSATLIRMLSSFWRSKAGLLPPFPEERLLTQPFRSTNISRT